MDEKEEQLRREIERLRGMVEDTRVQLMEQKRIARDVPERTGQLETSNRKLESLLLYAGKQAVRTVEREAALRAALLPFAMADWPDEHYPDGSRKMRLPGTAATQEYTIQQARILTDTEE